MSSFEKKIGRGGGGDIHFMKSILTKEEKDMKGGKSEETKC